MGKWKIFVLSILALMLLSSSFRFLAVAENGSNEGLFRFVWDDSLRGYYITSNKTFPLNVYILSLPDVGNYRITNHSAVVEGAQQAVRIHGWEGQVKELHLFLYFGLVAKLEVNVSYTMIENWNDYKTLVESANNTIIVNTHDEYLPVPEGYGKEEWTDKVADFMLNRWGTWVHAGGYPLYRVWYQNGTKKEWGEQGFKRLMSHIGKSNVTCYPPANIGSSDVAVFDGGAAQGMSSSWFLYGRSIGDYCHASLGYPIRHLDFEEQYLGGIYLWGGYGTGAVIRFSQNESAFNFGIYIHMSTWQFYDANGKGLPSDIALGFVSTTASIYSEFYYAPYMLYGGGVGSASESIQRAEKEGRTIGLAEAKNLFLNALDAFASGNYKLSTAYAMQAKQTAEKAAAAPNTLPQIVAIVTLVATSIGIGTYHKINTKKKNGEHN